MRIMREKQIFAVPTFTISEFFADHAATPEAAAREHQMLDLHASEFKKQLSAGVPIAMGSDVGPFPHGTQAREFVLMVKYGMSPLAAIQAGTINGAKLLGWQDQIGVLKPGYAADVVAVPGNPLEDIARSTKSFVRNEKRRHLPQVIRLQYFRASVAPDLAPGTRGPRQSALPINSLCPECDEHTMRRTEVSTESFGSDCSAIHENRRKKR